MHSAVYGFQKVFPSLSIYRQTLEIPSRLVSIPSNYFLMIWKDYGLKFLLETRNVKTQITRCYNRVLWYL